MLITAIGLLNTLSKHSAGLYRGGGLSIALWVLALRRVHQQYGERIFVSAVSATDRQRRRPFNSWFFRAAHACLGLAALFARISSQDSFRLKCASLYI
jgi:hypothetical protein